MKSTTSLLCKAASTFILVLTAILCIIKNGFLTKLQLALGGILLSFVFFAFAVVIDMIIKTMKEQKRINDSIAALSEKINIMLGLDKTTVAIENLKAETAPIYTTESGTMIKSEEDLTWTCPDCGHIELAANTVCSDCGYDKNKN